VDEIKDLKKERELNHISLNLEERKKLREKRDARKKEMKKIHEKSGHDKKEDFYLIETAHILSDYVLNR
jgi:hypothetical protein